METATENLARAPREDLVWLARLLLELAQERSLEGVLRKAIDAALAVPGVAVLIRVECKQRKGRSSYRLGPPSVSRI